MEGVGIPYGRMLREIEENWSLPDRRRTSRTASVFLQRNFNDDALRQPPPRAYTEAELDQARQDGFETGRVAGLAAAAASREAAEAEALAVLAGLLADAAAAGAQAADQAGAALARTLLGALGAVMPELVRRSALAEAESMLAIVLPGLSAEPAVTVEVPPAIEPGLGRLVARIAPDVADKVVVHARAQLAPGEVRVRWSAGQARRDPDAVWTRVMDRLEPALAPQTTSPAATATEDDHGN